MQFMCGFMQTLLYFSTPRSKFATQMLHFIPPRFIKFYFNINTFLPETILHLSGHGCLNTTYFEHWLEDLALKRIRMTIYHSYVLQFIWLWIKMQNSTFP